MANLPPTTSLLLPLERATLRVATPAPGLARTCLPTLCASLAPKLRVMAGCGYRDPVRDTLCMAPIANLCVAGAPSPRPPRAARR
jgi:hypothetical protein